MAAKGDMYITMKTRELPISSGIPQAEADQLKGCCPYFVSGKLAEASYVGIIGAFLHVCAWAIAFVLDCVFYSNILKRGKPDTVDPDDATKMISHDGTLEDMYYYRATYMFIPLVFGTAVIVGSIIYQLLAYSSLTTNWKGIDAAGNFTPAFMTLMTAGVTVSAVFTFMLLMGAAPADIHLGEKDFFQVLSWSLIAKIYVRGFLMQNNLYEIDKSK